MCLGAYAQTLGLEEILNRAELENPNVKIEELNVLIKKKSRDKALKNLVLPPVNLSTEEEWEIVKDEGFGFKEIEAVIPIFQGGKIYNSYKRSEKDLELSKMKRNLAVYKWQEESVSEYFNYLNYRKQKEITNNTIKALEKQKDRLSGLYKEGKMIPKSEVLKVEADIENNVAINLENLQKEKNSKENLMQLLGYDLDGDIVLSEFDPVKYLKKLGEITRTEKPEETTLGKAEEYNVDLAEYDLKITKGDLYPSFYVKPSHKFKENINGELRTVNEGMIEVGFRYVFEWGGTLDKVAQKEYFLEQAQIRYENNIKGIDLNMRNKLREIESLKGQSLALNKRVDLLKENLGIDNLRYENELVTTFDYLNSVNRLREAQEDYYKIQRELVLAVIEYENLYK